MHFTEYDTRQAAYAIVTDNDGHLLLTWFNGSAFAQPCWTMPGGGVEFDESIQDAAVREVFEETGFHVDVGEVVVTHHFTRAATSGRRPFRSQQFILDATITGGVLGTTEQGGSTDFARWVAIADIPRLDPKADVVDLAADVVRRTMNEGQNHSTAVEGEDSSG